MATQPPGRVERLLRPGRLVRVAFVDGQGAHRACTASVLEASPAGVELRVLSLRRSSALPESGAAAHLRVGEFPDGFSARVEVVRALGGASPVVRTTWPSAVEPVSRRTYFRVAAPLTAWTSLGEARLLDLSGGGCTLTVPIPRVGERRAAPGASVAVQLRAQGRTIPLDGRVLRTWTQDGRRGYAVVFEGIAEALRDQIIRLVFEHERRQLRVAARRRPSAGRPGRSDEAPSRTGRPD